MAIDPKRRRQLRAPISVSPFGIKVGRQRQPAQRRRRSSGSASSHPRFPSSRTSVPDNDTASDAPIVDDHDDSDERPEPPFSPVYTQAEKRAIQKVNKAIRDSYKKPIKLTERPPEPEVIHILPTREELVAKLRVNPKAGDDDLVGICITHLRILGLAETLGIHEDDYGQDVLQVKAGIIREVLKAGQ